MANMSYCRFRNTNNDLLDCLYALDCENSLSKEEADAGKNMFVSFFNFCYDNGIIDDPVEEDRIDELFDKLTEV